MSRSNSLALTILRWPVAWGSLATLGFYTLIHHRILDGQYVYRYFCSHPVEHASMGLFFIGIAVLAFKAKDIAAQMAAVPQMTLGPAPSGGQAVSEVGMLIGRVAEQAGRFRDGYLVRRLTDALEYVRRKGSADTLDEHLRYASDLDVGRMHSSYALMRIIIWAIPILGFLGTVMGITMAIAKLGPQDLEKSLPEVIHGLEVAFDTTALALALSIVLMFCQFITDRMEDRLLGAVDNKVSAELVGRFEEYGTATDPQAALIQRMAETVVQAGQRLVERQAELWQASIEAAHQHWVRSTASAGKDLEQTLVGALGGTLKQHTDALGRQQAEFIKQCEIQRKVVDATGQIKALETALNDNLSALSGAHHFEETVMSLSAAIGLLTAQLHSVPLVKKPRVDLSSNSSASAAA